MVMFTCNRCSKGLKKKDVLTHSFQCGGRNKINVACIDCLKDFRGDEYDRHTTCVSEEVRYGGKGVVVKETGKKQSKWLGIVRQVLSVNKSLDYPVRKFLQSVQHCENIPRQKKKFHNWANSAMHIKDTSFLDTVFEILQEEFTKTNEANRSNDATKGLTDDASDAQKQEQLAAVEGDEQQGGPPKGEAHAEESGVNGISKKKKKKRSQVDEEPAESAEPVENGRALENSGDDAKLSKKERKMKKKKAKFEAELQEIENVRKDDNTEDGVAKEEQPKTKKNKKRKLVDETNTGEPDMENVVSKGGKKKKVDQDQVSGNEELSAEAASPSKKEKFCWHEMIINVLMNSKNDELSIKKVSKKVIREYVSIYGDKGIHEKLNAKMTKKLQTCPGIRVLKDKVKLLETEE